MTVKSSTIVGTKVPKKQSTTSTSATATGIGTPTSAAGTSDIGGSAKGSIGTPKLAVMPSNSPGGAPSQSASYAAVKPYTAPATSNAGGSQSVANDVSALGTAPVVTAGTAGSLGNNSGYNQGNTSPATGAMANYGYTPQGMGSLYDNPVSLATDILKGMGITNPGLAQQLSQTLDPAVAANFLLNNGQNMSDNATLNFANQYMQNQVTPNGRTVDFGALVNHLLGAGSAMDPTTGKAANPLAAYLNTGLSPDQQVSAANALFGQTLGGLNPYAQQGMSRYAKDEGSTYQGAVAKGDPNATSYLDYLNGQSDLGNWARRG